LRIIVACIIHLILIGLSGEGGRDVWDRVKTRGRGSELKVITWKPEGKWSAERYQSRWEHNVKMGLL
jgi:hypothetical protein